MKNRSNSTAGQGSGLTTREVVGYGIGDFGFNLSFSFTSLFLLYFYTDVLGLSASTGGVIIMVALVWEGISDPAIGMLVNRTRSRYGRYRPYLLYGAVPLALVFAAMFLPVGLTGTGLVAYALATHLLFRTVYTFVNVPYIALSAQLTRDSLGRSRLAGARMMFAILCSLTLAAISLPLVARFGGGRQGFFLTALTYGALLAVVIIVCFKDTREADASGDDHQVDFRTLRQTVATNAPLLILASATTLGAIGYAMSGKALLYYMKYHAGSESAMTTGLTASFGAAAVSLPFWVWATGRTSKRSVWLAGTGLIVLVSGIIFLLTPKAGLALWLLLAIYGCGNAAFVLSFWAMVPDTVEYGEWKTGARAEGTTFGIIAFTQKVALGIGTGLLGILLDAIGYHANHAQAPGTLAGILVLYAVVPACFSLAAGVTIAFYPLDAARHREIVASVAQRALRSQSVA